VPFSGDPDRADIVIVGESPGRQEIDQGKPFVGDAGKLLREEMRKAGIDASRVMFANSARCRIDKDALTGRQISEVLIRCRPNLETLLNHVKPKLIICLGAIALQQVMSMKAIKKVRGQVLRSVEFGCAVFATWHPAYILRNASEMSTFRLDLEKIAEFIEGGFKETFVDPFTWKEVDSIRPLLDGGFIREGGGDFITALDTETQDTKWWSSDSVLLSYQVAASFTEGWTVVLHEEVPPGMGDFNIMVRRGGTKKNPIKVQTGVKRVPDFDRKVAELKELCERQDIKKYLMNLKFEKHRLKSLGIELVNAPIDVGLAAHCLDSEKFLQPSLRFLLESFTNIKTFYKDEISDDEKEDMIQVLSTDRKRFCKYASYDPVSTLLVALAVKKRLLNDQKSANYYIRFLHPVETEFLFDIERRGVLIDREALPAARRGIELQQEEKVAAFRRLCPEPVVRKYSDKFKLTRRRILMDALFSYEDEEGGLTDIGIGLQPIAMSKKTGEPVVDKDTMNRLLDMDIPDKAKELIYTYKEWSELNTLVTRYFPQIEENMDENGRIHPTYSFVFTSSGRTGARNPSAQNFPKRGELARILRRCIKAPPGFKLVEMDQSMAELRFIAHVADEARMKDIFARNGDIHKMTGLAVSGMKEEDLIPEKLSDIRKKAKAVNFGFVYGMMPKGFLNYARSQFGVKITMPQAKAARETFFGLYPGLVYWHQRSKDKIIKDGGIRSLFGRWRSLPNIYSQDDWMRMEAERIGINFEIQNPSSDYTLLGGKQAMDRNASHIGPVINPDECAPVLFTHDSFVFEIKEDKVEYCASILKANLEHVNTDPFGFRLTVPMKVEAEIGDNLGEMTPLAVKEDAFHEQTKS